jgi:hypothetical protein
MASFCIVTIQPAGYVHVRAFDEIILLVFHSLKDLGHHVDLRSNRFDSDGTNIIFGAHLLTDEQTTAIPEGSIIYNTEQLLGDNEIWNQRIVALSSRHRIWDYSSRNIEGLTFMSSESHRLRAERFRLGYHPRLKKLSQERSRDAGLVFFGSITPLREACFARLESSELLKLSAFFGVYGWQRDGILSRALACLNIHSQESRILEWPRILYLLANRVPCIALIHPQTYWEDQQLSYVRRVDEESPVAALEEFMADTALLDSFAKEASERFQAHEEQTTFTAAALDSALGSRFVPAREEIANSTDAGPELNSTGNESTVDVHWYRHMYPWVDSDPRGIEEFHRLEGVFRQNHPNRDFYKSFREPLLLTFETDKSSREDVRDPLIGVLEQKLAVVLHFYSAAMAGVFFADFGCHLVNADFYVTCSDDLILGVVKTLAMEYGIQRLEVSLQQNIGRDLLSKYFVFNASLSAYDLCLYSHGKESDHQWFHDHNTVLAGSPAIVKEIIELFCGNPSLGLVFPDYLSFYRPWIGWGEMRPMIDSLLSGFGCDTASIDLLEFPAGGFFWARPQALTIITSLGLTIENLPSEPLAHNHTLLHALERLPCISCEMMGMQWQKIGR